MLFAAMTVLWCFYSTFEMLFSLAAQALTSISGLFPGPAKRTAARATRAIASAAAWLNPNQHDGPPYLPIRVNTPEGRRTIYASTRKPHSDVALALVNIISTAAINAFFSGRNQRKSALKANTKEAATNNDDDTPDDLPPLKPGQRYFICDSGANRHYHPNADFIFRRETIRHPIGGLTDGHQATTDKFGIFCANLEDDKGRMVPITSVAFSVPNARVGLFSEVQAAFAGNTIVREGHPETGVHGIRMRSADGKRHGPFIPLHFSKKTLLWYIKVCPPDPFQCAHARRLDPLELANRGF